MAEQRAREDYQRDYRRQVDLRQEGLCLSSGGLRCPPLPCVDLLDSARQGGAEFPSECDEGHSLANGGLAVARSSCGQ